MHETSVHRARVRWEPEEEDLRAHTVELAEHPGAERVASLHHRAHERCFIANSVRCLVAVEPRDHPAVDS